MSYINDAKHIFLKGIDNNKNIPDSAKQELKQIIEAQFQIMGQFIGTTELLYLRELQHKQSSE